MCQIQRQGAIPGETTAKHDERGSQLHPWTVESLRPTKIPGGTTKIQLMSRSVFPDPSGRDACTIPGNGGIDNIPTFNGNLDEQEHK